MNQGVGAFRVFAWGLRKYAWLVALSVLAVGVLLPALQARAGDVYEASALVAPNRVTATNYDDMLRQAHMVANIAPNVNVKIPLIGEGIKLVKKLSEEGIKTNVTLCFTPVQA